MKKLVQICLLFGTFAAWSQQVQFVVPNGLADVEGNSSSADLFVNGTARMVQVYSASEFNLGAPELRIDAVSFRFESGTDAFLGFWGMTMGLSTTTRSPDALSSTFNENTGADEIMVFGGNLGILALNSSVSPRPFELRVAFRTPFIYDPTRGNLAVSIVSVGTGGLVLDAQFSPDDTIGRVFGENALSGVADSLGLITRFDVTPIPEPSSIPIASLGVGALLAVSLARPRRKHSSRIR